MPPPGVIPSGPVGAPTAVSSAQGIPVGPLGSPDTLLAEWRTAGLAPTPEQPGGLWHDLGDLSQLTFGTIIEQMAGAGESLTRAMNDDEARAYYQNARDQIRGYLVENYEQLSPTMQEALERKFATTGPDAAWRSIDSIVGQAMISAGSIIPSIVVSGLLAGPLGAKVALAAGLASEGLISGGGAAANMATEIESLTPEQLGAQSPRYQELVAGGASHEQAVDQLLSEVMPLAFSTTAAATAALGGVGGKVAALGGARIPGVRSGTGFAAGTARGAITEAGQETLQSGGEQLISNVIARESYDPSVAASEGILESMIAGGVLGGTLGGALGGVFRSDPWVDQSADLTNKGQPSTGGVQDALTQRSETTADTSLEPPPPGGPVAPAGPPQRPMGPPQRPMGPPRPPEPAGPPAPRGIGTTRGVQQAGTAQLGLDLQGGSEPLAGPPRPDLDAALREELGMPAPPDTAPRAAPSALQQALMDAGVGQESQLPVLPSVPGPGQAAPAPESLLPEWTEGEAPRRSAPPRLTPMEQLEAAGQLPLQGRTRGVPEAVGDVYRQRELVEPGDITGPAPDWLHDYRLQRQQRRIEAAERRRAQAYEPTSPYGQPREDTETPREPPVEPKTTKQQAKVRRAMEAAHREAFGRAIPAGSPYEVQARRLGRLSATGRAKAIASLADQATRTATGEAKPPADRQEQRFWLRTEALLKGGETKDEKSETGLRFRKPGREYTKAIKARKREKKQEERLAKRSPEELEEYLEEERREKSRAATRRRTQSTPEENEARERAHAGRRTLRVLGTTMATAPEGAPRIAEALVRPPGPRTVIGATPDVAGAATISSSGAVRPGTDQAVAHKKKRQAVEELTKSLHRLIVLWNQRLLLAMQPDAKGATDEGVLEYYALLEAVSHEKKGIAAVLADLLNGLHALRTEGYPQAAANTVAKLLASLAKASKLWKPYTKYLGPAIDELARTGDLAAFEANLKKANAQLATALLKNSVAIKRAYREQGGQNRLRERRIEIRDTALRHANRAKHHKKLLAGEPVDYVHRTTAEELVTYLRDVQSGTLDAYIDGNELVIQEYAFMPSADLISETATGLLNEEVRQEYEADPDVKKYEGETRMQEQMRAAEGRRRLAEGEPTPPTWDPGFKEMTADDQAAAMVKYLQELATWRKTLEVPVDDSYKPPPSKTAKKRAAKAKREATEDRKKRKAEVKKKVKPKPADELPELSLKLPDQIEDQDRDEDIPADIGGAGAADVPEGGEVQPDRTVPRPDRPAGPDGRPGLRVDEEASIPTPSFDVRVRGDNLGIPNADILTDDQQLGVNLAADAFASGKEGFLLGDGPGVGKTVQALAVAAIEAKRTGEPVLIVTIDENVEGRFREDAAMLGMRLSELGITVTRYSQLLPHRNTGVRKYHDTDWGLIVFDEAHELKNLVGPKPSRQAQAAIELKGQRRLFATATSIDNLRNAAYFLPAMHGIDITTPQGREEAGALLGYDYPDRGTGNLDTMNPILRDGWDDARVRDNIVKLRGDLIRAGQWVRRSWPFWGSHEVQHADVLPQDAEALAAIEAYYDSLPSSDKAAAGRRKLRGAAWAETTDGMAEKAYQTVKAELEAGRKVVVMSTTAGSQTFDWTGGKSGVQHPGGLEKLRDLLLADGVRVALAAGPRVKASTREAAIADFQDGDLQVLLGTPTGIGTGVDLDDQTGDAPRTLIRMGLDWIASLDQQVDGRVSRHSTKTPAKVIRLEYRPGEMPFQDEKQDKLATSKEVLAATQGDINVGTGREQQPESAPAESAPQPPAAPAAQTAETSARTDAKEILADVELDNRFGNTEVTWGALVKKNGKPSDKVMLVRTEADRNSPEWRQVDKAVRAIAKKLQQRVPARWDNDHQGWRVPTWLSGQFSQRLLELQSLAREVAPPPPAGFIDEAPGWTSVDTTIEENSDDRMWRSAMAVALKHEPTTRKVLKAIGRGLQPDHPFNSLIWAIEQALGTQRVELGWTLLEDAPAIAAYQQYELGGGNVIVSSDLLKDPPEVTARILLHELSHAVTLPTLRTDVAYAKEVRRLLRSAQVQYLRSHRHRREFDLVGDYWMTNPSEFLAEAMSDPALQSMLRTMKAPDGRTLWQRFVDLVRRVLGLADTTDNRNMLDAVLAAAGTAMRTGPTTEVILPTSEATKLSRAPTAFTPLHRRRRLTRMRKEWAARQQQGDWTPYMDAEFADAAAMGGKYLQYISRGWQATKHGTSKAATSSAALGWMSGRQLAEVFSDLFESAKGNLIKKHAVLEQRRFAKVHELQRAPQEIIKRWSGLQVSDPETHREVSELLSEDSRYDVWSDKPLIDDRNRHLTSEQEKRKWREHSKRYEALSDQGKAVLQDVRQWLQGSWTETVNLLRTNVLHTYKIDKPSPKLQDLATGPRHTPAMDKDERAKVTVKWKKDITDALTDLFEGRSYPRDQKARKALDKKVANIVEDLQEINNRARTKGPYFPLKRFGEYAVYGKKVRALRFNTEEELEQLKLDVWEKDPGAEVVQTGNNDAEVRTKYFSLHNTEAEAHAHRADLLASGEWEKSQLNEVTKKREVQLAQGDAGFGLMGRLEQKKAQGQISEANLNAIRHALIELLPDTSIRKAELRRQGVQGFTKDAIRSFATHSSSNAYYRAQLEFGRYIATALQEMDNYAQSLAETEGGSAQSITARDVVNELRRRDRAPEKAIGGDWVDRVTTQASKFGFLWFLASASYMMVNLTQPFIIGLPWLAARYGTSNATKAMAAALSVIPDAATNMRTSWSRIIAGEDVHTKSVIELVEMSGMFEGQMLHDAKAMMKALEERGSLTLTFAEDLQNVASGDTSSANRAFDFIRSFPHEIEKANRNMVALAAYKLAREGDGKKKEGVSHEEAVEFADLAVANTQFDYSGPNKPRHMQWKILRPVLLFKQYAQNMYYLMLRSLHQSFKGATPQQKREALKTLAGVLTAHGMVAGALGMVFEPVKFAIFLAGAMFGSDDEEFDHEVWLRRALVEDLGLPKTVAEAVARGLPRAVGVDLSSRIGLDNMLILNPGSHKDGEEWMGHMAMQGLGPLAGTMVSMAKSFEDFSNGQTLKGIGRWMPKGFRDLITAYRLGSEGMTDVNGNILRDTREFNVMHYAVQAIGFSPAQVAETYEGRAAVKGAETFASQRRRELLADYYRAETARERRELWKDIQKYNRRWPTFRITMGTIQRSMRERTRRQQQLLQHGGAEVPKRHQQLHKLGEFANL